jgi:hypothetical protein
MLPVASWELGSHSPKLGGKVFLGILKSQLTSWRDGSYSYLAVLIQYKASRVSTGEKSKENTRGRGGEMIKSLFERSLFRKALPSPKDVSYTLSNNNPSCL